MNRTRVISSNINAVGYDELTSILEIEFNSGSVYQYSNVPKDIYENLITANSIGQFFNRFIKSTYTYSRIS